MVKVFWTDNNINIEGVYKTNLYAPILLVSHLKLLLLKKLLDTGNTDIFYDSITKTSILTVNSPLSEQTLSKWYFGLLSEIKNFCIILKIHEEVISLLMWM